MTENVSDQFQDLQITKKLDEEPHHSTEEVENLIYEDAKVDDSPVAQSTNQENEDQLAEEIFSDFPEDEESTNEEQANEEAQRQSSTSDEPRFFTHDEAHKSEDEEEFEQHGSFLRSDIILNQSQITTDGVPNFKPLHYEKIQISDTELPSSTLTSLDIEKNPLINDTTPSPKPNSSRKFSSETTHFQMQTQNGNTLTSATSAYTTINNTKNINTTSIKPSVTLVNRHDEDFSDGDQDEEQSEDEDELHMDSLNIPLPSLPPKLKPFSAPWRNLRPQPTNSHPTNDINPAPPLAPPPTRDFPSFEFNSSFDFDDSNLPDNSVSQNGQSLNVTNGNGPRASAGSADENEMLRKEVANLKMMIMTRRHLDNLHFPELDENETTGADSDLKSLVTAALVQEKARVVQLQQENKDLLKQNDDCHEALAKYKDLDTKYNENLQETVELKDDLINNQQRYESIIAEVDELRRIVDEQDRINQDAEESRENHIMMANKILSRIIELLEGDSKEGAIRACDHSHSLDLKLSVINISVVEIIQDILAKTDEEIDRVEGKQLNLIKDVKERFKVKLIKSKDVEQELIQLIEEKNKQLLNLENDFTTLKHLSKNQSQTIKDLQEDLENKNLDITRLAEEIQIIQSKRKDAVNVSDQSEINLLKNRISIMGKSHTKKIDELNTTVKEYEVKLKNQRDIDFKVSELTSKISVLERQNQDLKDQLSQQSQPFSVVSAAEFQDLQNLLNKAQADKNDLLQDNRSLHSSLKLLQKEISERDTKFSKSMETASKELSTTANKIRSLADEKSMLGFMLSDIKKSKNELALINSQLTEKVGSLSYQVSMLSQSSSSFKETLDVIIPIFEAFITVYEEVLEESSVLQVKKKIDKLIHHRTSDNHNLIINMVKSLLTFFMNTSESLVASYFEDIERLNEMERVTGVTITDLQHKVVELTDQLKWHISGSESGKEAPQAPPPSVANPIERPLSPTSKLRVEDLERKWKLEREKRKMESVSAQRVIADLNKENEQLRRELVKYQYP